MRLRLLIVLLALVPMIVRAADDPILFTVGDVSVTRSEFEQSYLKNTTLSRVSHLTVADYLKLYITYKLKVKAAMDAHIDATSSFKSEYAYSMMDQPVVGGTSSNDAPMSRPGSDEWRIGNLGHSEVICPAQILIRVSQKASREEQRRAQQRIESIYKDLQDGADFGQMARQYSQDEKSASADGSMGWYGRGMMFKEIEDVAFGLQKGEMSHPFLSTIGYHILWMKDRRSSGEYMDMEDALSRYREQRQIHYQVSEDELSGDVMAQNVPMPVESVEEPAQGLGREYFEGLLLYEMSKQSVGRQAAEDEEALKYYFKKHKKKYRRKGFKPKDYTEVRELVVADLQEEMDKHWVDDLRKKYPVKVNKKVLKTVNKHH